MERPARRPARTRRARGYTLMEALITTSLVAVLVTVGVPGFRMLILDNRRVSALNGFVASLQHARIEAIKRGERVVLCPSADAERCLATGDWHRGWLAFVDRDRDRERDAGEAVLWAREALAPGQTLTSSRYRRRIRFLPEGFAPGSNLTVTYCDPRGAAAARAIVVSNAGRPRLTDARPGGRPLSCP